MPLPTLLRVGFVVPRNELPQREKDIILNTRTVDHITNFISDRVPMSRGITAKIQPRSFGDKVIILKSDTGSGKTTVLPPFLYEVFQTRINKNIAITQPKVLTAVDKCMELPHDYKFLKLDDNLGYITGEFKRKPKNKGIIFMTVGTLLQQLKVMDSETFMNYYSFILIDEVHDRSIDVDMSLYILKKLFILNYENPNCPMLILMSATFDEKIFMDYFNCPPENFITVVGSTFPITPHYLQYDTPNYIKKAIDIIEQIHVENISDINNNEFARDIIVFVFGANPIKELIGAMHLLNAKLFSQSFNNVIDYVKKKKENNQNVGGGVDQRFYLAPIELSSKSFMASGEEYRNLFSKINEIKTPIYKLENDKITEEIREYVIPSRRVIVATVVAETGVTIKSLKYCIDTGYLNSVEFNPDFSAVTMIIKNVTKSSAIQRRGRVGRVGLGYWYPCYTEKTFNSLNIDQFAQILVTDITESLLSIIVKETESVIIENEIENVDDKIINLEKLFITNRLSDNKYYKIFCPKLFNMSSVDFLESPSSSSLNYSMEKLHGLGFIDSEYKPTRIGMYGYAIRKVSIENKRMLFAGYSHGANVLDLITIVAFLEVGKISIFKRKYQPINANKGKLTDKEYEFYFKVVIADELIEYILIWELFCEFINDIIDKIKKTDGYQFSIDIVYEWCSDRKIVYDGLMKVIETRNEIIESFISIGLNPYYNGLNINKGYYNLLDIFRTNISDFIDEVRKLKNCIYDGYRFNLCIWNNKFKKYIIHHRNIPLSIYSNVNSRMGDDAIQTNPNYLIITHIMLRASQKTKGMYEFESSGAVSVLDSYVNVDLDFFKH